MRPRVMRSSICTTKNSAAEQVYGQREVVMDGNWAAATAIASIALACAIYYTATAWFAHRERMAKIERGIDPDQPIPKQLQARQPLSDRVKQLASNSARKIEAIKVYREETGTGLADAKEAVEEYINSK